jgi:cobalt/nickel transport protein
MTKVIPRDRKLLIICGLLVLAIALTAPFLASGDPDGLESTSEKVDAEGDGNAKEQKAPFSNYEMPGVAGEGSSMAALVLGTLITLFIVVAIFYGLARLKRGKRENVKSESSKEETPDKSHRSNH